MYKLLWGFLNKPLASIISVGISKFGKRVGLSARELFQEGF
jgi:hypothetical protein